jgi:hypothetical protein
MVKLWPTASWSDQTKSPRDEGTVVYPMRSVNAKIRGIRARQRLLALVRMLLDINDVNLFFCTQLAA